MGSFVTFSRAAVGSFVAADPKTASAVQPATGEGQPSKYGNGRLVASFVMFFGWQVRT